MITISITIREIAPGCVPVLLLASGSASPAEGEMARKIIDALKAHAEASMKAAGGGKMFEHDLSPKPPKDPSA